MYGFTGKMTHEISQDLYENGLITVNEKIDYYSNVVNDFVNYY